MILNKYFFRVLCPKYFRLKDLVASIDKGKQQLEESISFLHFHYRRRNDTQVYFGPRRTRALLLLSPTGCCLSSSLSSYPRPLALFDNLRDRELASKFSLTGLWCCLRFCLGPGDFAVVGRASVEESIVLLAVGRLLLEITMDAKGEAERGIFLGTRVTGDWLEGDLEGTTRDRIGDAEVSSVPEMDGG